MFSDFDKEKSKLLYNKSYSSDDNNEGIVIIMECLSLKSTFEKGQISLRETIKEALY